MPRRTFRRMSLRVSFLWEKNNCMGCHTVMGEGAYYAPELTNVISRRGEAYVKSVLMDMGVARMKNSGLRFR